MTLDEAIAKAKADGDVQLAEWLRQARGADAAARWYTEKLRDANRAIRKLLDENTKLRDEVERLRSVVSDGADNAREVLAENSKLRKLVASYLRKVRSPVGPTVERDYMAEFRALGIEVD